MELVISYTSADREKLTPLLDGLHRMRYNIWFDDELTGGQAWWDAILERIRSCDAMLPVLSPAFLESIACNREVDYARALGRPVLPVMIESVRPELVFPALAAVQIVDYTQAGGNAAFDLMGALRTLPSAPPLPDPLPDPPPVPISYLSSVSERVRAPSLRLDEQLGLVSELRLLHANPRDRQVVLELIEIFSSRPDLYAAPARQLQELIQQTAAIGNGAWDSAWREWANREFGENTARSATALLAAMKSLKAGATAEEAVREARRAATSVSTTMPPFAYPAAGAPAHPPAAIADGQAPSSTRSAPAPVTALASVMLGLLSLPALFGDARVAMVLAGLAIVLGWLGLARSKRPGISSNGPIVAWIGVALGAAGLLMGLIWLIAVLQR